VVHRELALTGTQTTALALLAMALLGGGVCALIARRYTRTH
jgi:LPXTG-motif cell wall-anchored protein